jgi:hypothetical protein
MMGIKEGQNNEKPNQPKEQKMKSLKFFKPALAITLAIVLGWLLSVRPAEAGYTVTLQQVGPDVVATGSGAIDLTGLTFLSPSADFAGNSPRNSQIRPGAGEGHFAGGIVTGPTSWPTSSSMDFYLEPSGPTSFGSGGLTLASSGSGHIVGTATSCFGLDCARYLIVPMGYVSGTFLSNSATWSGETFATLGVTPGTYVWTWGTGANQNFTLQIGDVSPTPTPTATPFPGPSTQIDGSGTIAAPRGRRDAQFSIFDVENAQLSDSQSLEGEFSYLDKKSHIRLTSVTIQTVTINGNQGAFTGIGRLKRGPRSKRMVQFTVTVTASEGAVPDTFSIVLDNGYSASGNLPSGSILIRTLDPDPD